MHSLATDRRQIALKTYIGRYRQVFRVRLLTIAGLSIAVGCSYSPGVAAIYAISAFALFALYIWVIERAARRLEEPGIVAQLKAQSSALDLIVALPSVLLGIQVNAAAPYLHIECQLLMVTLVLLGGLQVHLTRLGMILSVLPAVLGLVWISLPDLPRGHTIAHLWGVGLFALSMFAASWRQHASDRQSALEAAEIAARNVELQLAVDEARRQQHRAEVADRAKSHFLAVASHGVRTPLNAVLAMAHVLSSEATTPRQSELAGGVAAAGAMLMRLLNGVLDFTRVESGEEKLDLVATDLRQLVGGIVEVWRAECGASGVSVRIEFEGAPEDLVVLTDPGRVEQTLVNFLSNAVKHSPRGDEIVLGVTARAEGAERVSLRFQVADAGPGVPATERARIFDAFEQTDAGRAAGGAGMGLAICRINVEHLGGRYGVQDRPGGGAEFWFEIEAERTHIEPAPEPAAEPAAPCGLRVLAADDHPANREVLRLILGALDLAPDLVENGEEAVLAAARAPYDLILMDAKMPVMDGEAAIRAIREAEAAEGRHTPIVMVTANVFPEDVQRYLAVGADQVLAKPIDIPALHACVREVASGQALSSQPTAVAAA